MWSLLAGGDAGASAARRQPPGVLVRRVEFWWSRLAGFTLAKQTALAPTLVQPLHLDLSRAR